MKHVPHARLMVTVMLLLGAMTTATFAQRLAIRAAGTKTVTISDKVGDNQFEWTSEAPLEDIRGTAGDVSGSFTINLANPSAITGTITASVSSMKSGNTMRDHHIKSDEWLDASNHDQISFRITSVKNTTVSGNKLSGTAVGTFTMHGVSKAMAIPFTLTYIDESAATRKRAPGDLVMVTAKFDVKLADFDVQGSKGLVGSKVAESISIEAKLFGSTAL